MQNIEEKYAFVVFLHPTQYFFIVFSHVILFVFVPDIQLEPRPFLS